jgi:predicted chitinase
MSTLKSISCSVTLSTLDTNGKPLKDTFEAGKDLASCSVQVGEGDRSNACTFTIKDPGLKIAAKYRGRSLSTGGIRVPVNLLEKPDKADKAENASTAVPNIDGNPKGDDLARAIVAYCRSNGITDTGQVCYILATAQHESGMGQYSEEIESGAQYEGRQDLGNTQPGDGVKFKGRGYVQVTGRKNYDRWSKFLGIDAIANPALLAQPKYAISTLCLGMTGKNGAPNFTGVTVGQYINGGRRDFVGAREVVNGSDRASLIASYAEAWLGKIASLDPPAPTATTAKSPAKSPEQFGPVALVPKDSKTAIDDVKKAVQAALPKDPIPPDCTEITVTFADHAGAVVSFAFWLVGESATNQQLERSTFQGRGIRFLIGAARNRNTLKNISLRQLAERIGDRVGANVEIPNKPASEKINQVLTQNGETDYQFLLRVAQASGYTIKEEKPGNGQPPKLTLVEAKAGAKIKADRSWVSALTTSDQGVFQTADKIAVEALPPISELADGEKIGEGYVTDLEIPNPSIAQLTIQPGSILEVQPDLAPKPIARDYRIKSLRWTWKGAITGSISLYIPVNVKAKPKEEKTANADANGFQALSPTAGTGSEFSIPGLSGKFNSNSAIVIGGLLTWGQITYSGQRIPENAQITQNIVQLASEFQRVVVPILNGRKPTISSGYRPKWANDAAGGSPTSLHLTGSALDFWVDAMPGTSLHSALDPVWNGELGYYSDGRVHIAVNSPRKRFNGG